MSVFFFNSAQAKLEKCGYHDLNHDNNAWNTYLGMFEKMWVTKDWSQYVISITITARCFRKAKITTG
jgi:hypothetical protein